MKTKEKLLLILDKNKGNFVSGQEIAEQLQVSRTAVWKAIKTLKYDGYKIESVKNNGYKLSSENDILSEGEIRNNLFEKYKNFVIKIFKSTDSTNKQAKKLIAENTFENGTVLIADEQTEGKGRFGRKFFSPKGTGIYLSTIIKSNIKVQDISLIAVVSALAVCRSIKNLTKLNPQIKWINDVYINGKKVCGILTEAVSNFETQTADAVVVGIGINLKTKLFPEELKEKAGYITTDNISRNVFVAEVLNNLFSLTENLFDKKIIEDYKKFSFVLKKEIKYLSGDTVIKATAVDINDKGNLVVEDSNGKKSVLESGEISINLSHNFS